MMQFSEMPEVKRRGCVMGDAFFTITNSLIPLRRHCLIRELVYANFVSTAMAEKFYVW